MVISQFGWTLLIFVFGMCFAGLGFAGYFKEKKRQRKAGKGE